jgi:hypothetical protein
VAPCGFCADGALCGAIRQQATRDEARPADAIVVFGAARYNSARSPVIEARLEQVYELEERGLALVLVTSRGRGGDPRFGEGGAVQSPASPPVIALTSTASS